MHVSGEGGIRNGMSAAVRLKSGQGWPRQRVEESLRRRAQEVPDVVGGSPAVIQKLRLHVPSLSTAVKDFAFPAEHVSADAKDNLVT